MNKLKAIQLHFLLCGVAMLSSLPCAIAQPENFVKYINAHHGFSISFPSDWKCTSTVDKSFALHIRTAELTDNYLTVTVVINYADEAVNLAEQAGYLKAIYEKSDGYHFVAEGNTKINGKEVYQISYSNIHKGKEAYNTAYITVSGNRIVLINRTDLKFLPLLTGVLHDIVYSYEEMEPYTKAKRERSNALFKAAWVSDFALVKKLVAEGAQVDDVHETGTTALHSAAMGKDFELFSFLIENGANVNSRNPMTGVTPVFGVNWNGDSMGKINFYQLLIDKGADINAKNYKGETVSQKLKAMYSKMADVKFLKSKGGI